MKNPVIFLDNASSTKPFEDILSLSADISLKLYGNPSSNHSLGREARKALDDARDLIAEAISVSAKKIIFTSTATEANNLIVHSLCCDESIQKILISRIEHESILKPLKLFASGKLKAIPVNDYGEYDIDFIEQNMSANTAIMITYVNNELGIIQDLSQILEIRSKTGGRIFLDCVQAIGKTDLKFIDEAEYATFSSHKIHGPRGAACIYVRDRSLVSPFITGGEQEFSKRAGTENVGACYGFSLAFKKYQKSWQDNEKHIRSLRDRFVVFLKQLGAEMRINTKLEKSSPHIVNVSFPKFSSEMLLLQLDQQGICISGGSACSSQSIVMSHVMESLPIDESFRKSAVRFSFSIFNTTDEIIFVSKSLKKILTGQSA